MRPEPTHVGRPPGPHIQQQGQLSPFGPTKSTRGAHHNTSTRPTRGVQRPWLSTGHVGGTSRGNGGPTNRYPGDSMGGDLTSTETQLEVQRRGARPVPSALEPRGGNGAWSCACWHRGLSRDTRGACLAVGSRRGTYRWAHQHQLLQSPAENPNVQVWPTRENGHTGHVPLPPHSPGTWRCSGGLRPAVITAIPVIPR